MQLTNLFELLGRPVALDVGDSSTRLTASPETYDDDGFLPGLGDINTMTTRAHETYDEDTVW